MDTLRAASRQVDSGPPPKYELTFREEYTDQGNKVRKLSHGQPNTSKEEKVFLLVGETGTGKSTLMDAIINYIFGVKWTTEYRFTIVRTEAEGARARDQTISQTEWVTAYTIYHQHQFPFPYTLTIIDTPGFGDTRGIEHDEELFSKVRTFFNARKSTKISQIDVVCFLVKASCNRLSVAQSYIFHSILSMFGKNIKDNIAVVFTFADIEPTDALQALGKANVPNSVYVDINNAALFQNTSQAETSTLRKKQFYWNEANGQMKKLLHIANNVASVHLDDSLEVLDTRSELCSLAENLGPLMKNWADKRAKLEEAKTQRAEALGEEDRNKNYKTKETRCIKTDVPLGALAAICKICPSSVCHPGCEMESDEYLFGCKMMEDGKCTKCEAKCIWSEHVLRTDYKLVSTEEFELEIPEMKKMLEESRTKIKEESDKISDLETALKDSDAEFSTMCHIAKTAHSRLANLALEPEYLTIPSYIETLISYEKNTRNAGYEKRLEFFREKKQNAENLQLLFACSTGTLGSIVA